MHLADYMSFRLSASLKFVPEMEYYELTFEVATPNIFFLIENFYICLPVYMWLSVVGGVI